MKRQSRILLNRIYAGADMSLSVLICGSLFLGGIGLIPRILDYYGVWANHYYTLYYAFMKPVLVVMGVVIVALGLLGILIHPFTAEHKDEIDANKVDSPLKGLSKDQEKAIIALLKEKGKPQDENGKMKRSEMAYLLNALIELGYIDAGTDNDILRLWTIKVTGYKEDDKVHFAEALDRSRRNNKAAKTKDLVAEMLSNIS